MPDTADAPLSLLHVVPTYYPAVRYGGPIYSIRATCAELVRQGHRVQVFTTNVDGPGVLDVPVAEPVDVDGVEVTYFASSSRNRVFYSGPLSLAAARTAARVDVVHAHGVFGWPTVAAALAARRAGTPFVLAPRGALVPELIARKSRLPKTIWLRVFERHNLAYASRLHVTSMAEYRDACRLPHPMPPPLHVPNGLSAPDPDSLPPMGPELRARVGDAPYLLFLGRLHWVKGLDRLLAALAGTPIRVLIAGDDEGGHRASLETLVRQHGLVEQVAFLGRVDGADKWRLMQGARALVLPSYRENFGNVVVEAMAMGCPAIVTREVGAREVVGECGGGLVVDGDPEALRRGLMALWSDGDARADMGQRAQRFVRDRLSSEATVRSLVEGYRQLLR